MTFKFPHRASPSRPALVTLAALLCLAAPQAAFAQVTDVVKPMRPAAPPAASSNAARLDAIHVLNRAAFGPRPGDIDAVTQIGARNWIEQQLQPDRIDDSAVDAKLRKLWTLSFKGPQLILAYESDNAFGKEMKAAKDKKDNDAKVMFTDKKQETVDEARKAGFTLGMGAETVGAMTTAKLARAVESPRQLQEVLVDFWCNHFNLDVNKGPVRTLRVADERDAIRPFVFGKFRSLLGASAHSPAMLFYLDNVKSTREMDGPLGRRQARRNQAPLAVTPVAAKTTGKPGDTMMAADGDDETTPMPPVLAPKRGGVNENYARELMELHTLGVGGGYTQTDVQEVARCFTGWSMDKEGQFIYRPGAHDNGAKTVLGQTIPAGGGQRDGEMVLDILASNPATARFIARKLAVRLVSDDPPAVLVDRAAQSFLKTGGDLREVTRTILLSPEFFGPAARRAKIKSPFEFAVSAVRAMDGAVWVPDPTLPRERMALLREGRSSLGRGDRDRGGTTLARACALMGQPLFAFAAPTGYAEDSQTWVSTGGLVARLNFALDLSAGSVTNALIDREKLFSHVDLNDADAIIDRLNERILTGAMTASTRATLEKQSGATPDPNKLLALTLGSPEFQRR